MSTFLAELDACKALRQGWDGADAPRPTMIAILSAREFVLAALAANLPMERVAPSVIGGIGILFARDKAESYVEFYDNGTGYVLLANGRCNPKVLPILDESGRFPHTLAMIGAHLDT